MLRQFQGKALENSSIASPPRGKLNSDLADDTTQVTEDSWHWKFNPDRPWAYGDSTKPAHYLASALDFAGTTDRAAKIKDILSNSEMDGPVMIFSVNILVSMNAKSVVQ
jgi:hypothetical protein